MVSKYATALPGGRSPCAHCWRALPLLPPPTVLYQTSSRTVRVSDSFASYQRLVYTAFAQLIPLVYDFRPLFLEKDAVSSCYLHRACYRNRGVRGCLSLSSYTFRFVGFNLYYKQIVKSVPGTLSMRDSHEGKDSENARLVGARSDFKKWWRI